MWAHRLQKGTSLGQGAECRPSASPPRTRRRKLSAVYSRVVGRHCSRALGGWHSGVHVSLICLSGDSEKPSQPLCERESVLVALAQSPRALHPVLTPLCLYRHFTLLVFSCPPLQASQCRSSTVPACALGTGMPGARGPVASFPDPRDFLAGPSLV